MPERSALTAAKAPLDCGDGGLKRLLTPTMGRCAGVDGLEDPRSAGCKIMVGLGWRGASLPAASSGVPT